MNYNIERILFLFISFLFLIIGLGLLIFNLSAVDKTLDEFKFKPNKMEIIETKNNDIIISDYDVKSLMGELLLATFREKSVNKDILIDGKLLKLRLDSDIPKLYIGSSNVSVDFSKPLPKLSKKYYKLFYEYDSNLEISAYRLK